MRTNPDSITNKGLIGIGRQLRAEFGASLTCELFCRQTGFTPEFINQRFGSWVRFRRALGLTLPAASGSRQMSKAELLVHLRRLADQDGNIAMRDFCRQLGITRHTICEHFGSWRNMREQAGLPRIPAGKREITNQELLDDLLRIFFKAGRCPGFHDYKRWGGKFSPTTLLSRFGNWKGVQAALELHRREHMARTDPTWSWEKEQQEKRIRKFLERSAPSDK